jgi:mono/diheme cytochrome c family protein
MRKTLVTRTWIVVFALISSAGIASAQDAALVKKGQEIYAAQKCSMCHGIAGAGSKANPLDGVGKKLSADDIRQWIVSPAEATAKAKSTKKPPMPAKYGTLAAADIDALVAYMQSLK